MKPNHTKDQRKRLFLLARLLDRVPRKHFDMKWWIIRHNHYQSTLGPEESPNDCGTTACACGWALTIPSIAKRTRKANMVPCRAFGMERAGKTEFAMFGGYRKAGPRRVAADIRRYLKDGTLPKS